MASVEGEPGWILHYRRYRETSLLLDSFTLAHGRVPLLARGALGPRSRQDLHQPFRPLLIDWHGASGLRTLRGLEESGPALALRDGALACAYYLNELLLRLLGEHDPQPELFAHYTRTLGELADAAEFETPLRRFELQLLDRLGSLPDLATLVAGGVREDSRYTVDPETFEARALDSEAELSPPRRAPVRLGPKSRLPGDPSSRYASPPVDNAVHDAGVAPAASPVEIAGRSLLAMARVELDDAEVRADAKRLLRRVIQRHLGGRPLRSRAVFGALAQGSGRASEEADPAPD